MITVAGAESFSEDLIDPPRIIGATIVGLPNPEEPGRPLSLRHICCQPADICEHCLDLIVGEALDQVDQLGAARGHGIDCRHGKGAGQVKSVPSSWGISIPVDQRPDRGLRPPPEPPCGSPIVGRPKTGWRLPQQP
jgi:hypothetical protein